LPSLSTSLFIEISKGFPGLGKPLQQRSHLPSWSEFMLEARNALDDALEADRIRIEHWATAPCRKPISVHINAINIRSPQGKAFFQHACTFMNQAVQSTLDDLVVGEFPLRNGCFPRERGDQFQNFGIWRGLPVLAVVVPPFSGLLSEAPNLAKGVGDKLIGIFPTLPWRWEFSKSKTWLA
jgi:hypothetical protein